MAALAAGFVASGRPVLGAEAEAADPAGGPLAPADQALAPGHLPGQLSSKFRIDSRDPESSIPSVKERNRSPLEFGYLLQDLVEFAARAQQSGDFEGAIKYYRAVAKAVPDVAKSWSKLCEAYETAKDRDRAIRACKYAIDRKGVELQDYLRYVRLILSGSGPLTASEQTELDAVLSHLSKQQEVAVAPLVVAQLRCEMGVKTKSVPTLEACTKELSRVAPEDSRTAVFLWNLALLKGQRAEAERYIGQAKKAGVVLENIERMQRTTSDMVGPPRRLIIALGAVLACLAGAGALVWRRRTALHRVTR